MKGVDARAALPLARDPLGQAARELGGAGRSQILADDPIAPRELKLLCEERGWGFAAVPNRKRRTK